MSVDLGPSRCLCFYHYRLRSDGKTGWELRNWVLEGSEYESETLEGDAEEPVP